MQELRTIASLEQSIIQQFLFVLRSYSTLILLLECYVDVEHDRHSIVVWYIEYFSACSKLILSSLGTIPTMNR